MSEVYSADGHMYHEDIEDIIDDLSFSNDDDFPIEGTIYIAEKIPTRASNFSPHAHWFLEHAGESAYQDCGESAEGYLSEVTNEQVKELEDMLENVFDAWSKKHGHEPNFWGVKNARKATIIIHEDSHEIREVE